MTRNVLRWLVSLVAIAVMVLAGLVLWDLHRVLIGTVPAIAKQTNLDLEEIHRATLEAGLTLENVRKASVAWQQSSAAQAAAASDAEKNVNSNLHELQLLIARTNSSINGDLEPRLARAIDDQNAGLAAIEKQTADSMARLNDATAELGPVLSNLAAASANAAKITADPSITDSLHDLQLSAASLAVTSSNAARASGDLADAIHRETRPASFTVRLAGWVVDAAGKIGSILAGFVK